MTQKHETMEEKNRLFWSCFFATLLKITRLLSSLLILGMTPEQVANEAVRMLLYNVNGGGCVDDMLQEQVSCNFQ